MNIAKLLIVEIPFFAVIFDALINIILGKDMTQWAGYLLITNVGVSTLGLFMSMIGSITFLFLGKYDTAGIMTGHIFDGFSLILVSLGINLMELYVKMFTWPIYLILGPNAEVDILGMKVSVKVVIDALEGAMREMSAPAPYQGNTVRYFEDVYNTLGQEFGWKQIDLSWAYNLTGVLTTGYAGYKIESSSASGGGNGALPRGAVIE
ncbi:MAG: hypothetical protein J7L47_08815 [Candidatus Odinarchaeota archaeon]|nr:hypothetical protein [Candidatus Odinarchaeota archaeon]